MTKREKIARLAAKRAAQATYQSIMHAPLRKVATVDGVKAVAPSLKDAAKLAAAASYDAVIKMAQLSDDPTTLLKNTPNLQKVVDVYTNESMPDWSRFPAQNVVSAANELMAIKPEAQKMANGMAFWTGWRDAVRSAAKALRVNVKV